MRVEPEGGHPLRTWSASGSAVGPDGGPLWRHLTDGHDTTGRDGLDAALASADACLWSPGGPGTPADLVEVHPHLTVVAITPFGLDGPWADRPATDLTLQALSGGIIGLGRGDPEQPPVQVGGRVGEWLTGAWAAVALLTVGRTGAPGIVDLSMLEAQAMCLTGLPLPVAPPRRLRPTDAQASGAHRSRRGPGERRPRRTRCRHRPAAARLLRHDRPPRVDRGRIALHRAGRAGRCHRRVGRRPDRWPRCSTSPPRSGSRTPPSSTAPTGPASSTCGRGAASRTTEGSSGRGRRCG